ncbi:MAG: creatininase family protein [Rhodospirillaceae bacterium]|nr:creatininase family protein [Rhodospirillaceae bacterium]
MAGIVRFAHLTWPEIVESAKEKRLALIPAGTVEAHGPHLPLDTDIVIAEAICDRAAALIPDEVILVPTISYGFGPHHMDMPGNTIGWKTLVDHTLGYHARSVAYRLDRMLINQRARLQFAAAGYGGAADDRRTAAGAGQLHQLVGAVGREIGRVQDHRFEDHQPRLRDRNFGLSRGASRARAHGPGRTRSRLRAEPAYLARSAQPAARAHRLQEPGRVDGILEHLDLQRRARRSAQGHRREGPAADRRGGGRNRRDRPRAEGAADSAAPRFSRRRPHARAGAHQQRKRPGLMGFEQKLLQLLFAGIGTGAIYALIAVGFNVIYKSTDAINFTQGEWVMMGGMIGASLFLAGHVPVWIAVVIGVAAVAVIGLLSERLVVLPLRRPTPVAITLVTIGLAICTKAGVMLTLGKQPAGYPAFSGDTPIVIGGASIHPQTFWILGITALFMLAAHFFFARTRLGKAMRAAAADRQAAALVGISTRRVVMWAFGFAATAGAVAGVIITPLTTTSYEAGTILGFKGFSAAMLGGLGSLYGAAAGGLLLGLLEAMASGYISSQFKDAVAFLVLLLVLFWRPTGLFGGREAVRV